MADYLDISSEFRKKIEEHYLRPKIIKAMLDSCPGKEVVGSFGGVGYAKRPDVLEYENDVSTLVKKGITSFHISEETWQDPLNLKPGMSKKEQDSLRIGWDLIIDIDCPHWDICKVITHLITQEIKLSGVNNVSVKFSGNKGFHIGIPNDSFEKSYHDEFPDLPKKICSYLLNSIFEKAKNEVVRILKRDYGENYFDVLEETFKKPRTELIKNGELNPYSIIEVDTILLNSRHLYRMVYSVNEKSGLISIPINPDKILNFEKDLAKIENNIFSKFVFLDRDKSVKGETKNLVYLAKEHSAPELYHTEINNQLKELEEKSSAEMEFEAIKEMIPEKYFPESIQKMLSANYSDGKKRAIFVLKNFLSCVGWSYDEISERLIKWNNSFTEPLRESILNGQLINLKTQMVQNRLLMPPNFETNTYYLEIIGECRDYKLAKNPVTLAIKRFTIDRKQIEEEEKQKKKLKKQLKE